MEVYILSLNVIVGTKSEVRSFLEWKKKKKTQGKLDLVYV